MRNKLQVFVGILLIITSGFPLDASAAVQTQFFAPLQYNTTTAQGSFINAGTYQRESFDLVGGIVEIVVNRNNNPDPGDSWPFGLRDGETQQLLGIGTFRYDGLQNCFLGFDNNPIFCDVFVPPEDGSTFIYQFSGFFDVQCARTQGYELLTQFNSTDHGGSPHPFRPTEFPVGVPEVMLSNASIRPKIPKFPETAGGDNDVDGIRNAEESAGATQITALVKDGIQRPGGGNCGVSLPNIDITLENTIVPRTGSHLHFGNPDEPGTGRYDAAPADQPGHRVTGTTDAQGKFQSNYKAGEFGLDEFVTALARDPATNTDILSEPETLRIEIPGLSSLDTDGVEYTLAGTGRLCDSSHNASATVPALRETRYVTPKMYQTVRDMVDLFAFHADPDGQLGLTLSFNDASLPLGGMIDNGAANRNDDCHDTHRDGVDIDVNRGGGDCTTSSNNLRCPFNYPQLPGINTREELLTMIVKRDLLGKPIFEGPLHYRFLEARQ